MTLHVHPHLEDNTDTPEQNPTPPSGSWRRDKRDLQRWAVGALGMLLVGMIAGGFTAYQDMQTRMARVETKVDDISKHLDQFEDRIMTEQRENTGSIAGPRGRAP